MNKIYFAFLIYFSLGGFVLSQNMDFDERAESRSGKIYQSYSSQTLAAWVSLPNTPNSYSRSCCALVRINGTDYLYQFGGGNSTSDLRRVARLNLSNNTWSNNITTMPHPVSSGTAISMRGDSLIYVFGGYNNNLGKTMRYNVYTNSWTTMLDMPTEVTDAFVVKYSEHLIYVIGGGSGYFGSNEFRTNRVQLYNINNNTYTVVNNYPINCAMLGGGIYRDTIIAVGGYTNGGNATANCYKGVVNTLTYSIDWTPIASYPAGPILRFASHIAVKDDGVGVMCTGGALNGGTATAQTFFYNFCTQTWQNNLPNNALARSNFKATGRGNEIYVCAGFTNTGVGNTEKMIFNYIDGPCQNMLGINNNGSIPAEFSLKQNYPNPFNPSTKISFGLPNASEVKITVYDIRGQEISVITDKFYTAGNHQVEFNGSNFSCGIYYYTLTSGEINLTKKMVLVK
jgi:hypothetical protein